MLLNRLRTRLPGGKAASPAKRRDKLRSPDAVGVATIADGPRTYRFCYRNSKEKNRAQRILEKEPGTIDWIRRELQPDDVFYDIGANIGVYTIFAAARIGEHGKVYAFEPHVPNAASLIENIFANDATKRVLLVTNPLTETEHYNTFNYQSILPASSTSQFGRNSYEGKAYETVFQEIKFGTTIDTLIDRSLVRPPNMIKIDVDGLDYEVLVGMRRLLGGPHRPRSLQIELGSDSMPKIMRLCAELGYELKEKHWSKAGQNHIAAGHNPDSYPHYGIFSTG